MDSIEREITLPVEIEQAWALLTRPDELSTWLGDDVVLDPVPGSRGHVLERDGSRRSLVVEEAIDGQRLSWRWWQGDDAADASRVEITLTPTRGGTTVRVVEHLPTTSTPVARAAAAEAWSHRLLHLEALLLVAAAVRG
jgi:uncharacterized protein YndB with AHSA1/START domain